MGYVGGRWRRLRMGEGDRGDEAGEDGGAGVGAG